MNTPINDDSLHGPRMLDAAKGILVGLRGCTLADAFSEILCVADEYQVGPLSVAHALVTLAEGSRRRRNTPAAEAAYRTWARLVDHPAPRNGSRDDDGEWTLDGARR